MPSNHSVLFLTVVLLCGTVQGQEIVAHRGASHDAPENTLAAFELAWEQRCDGIEGDFYLTADGKIVCIHDKDTKRTTGKNLVVEKSSLADLRVLDAGSWKGKQWGGEKIPTFAEVLKTVRPGGLFVIELKSKSQIVPVLAKELASLDTAKIRMLIISFDAETVRQCKKMIPNVPAHWLTKFRQSAPGGPFEPTAEQVAETVRQCGADGVGMKGMTEVIDETFVSRLRKSGCDEFHVWTIDSERDARYFRELGTYGITTNRPAEINAALKRQPDKK